MSFLSLGLENEEQQASPERNLSEDIRNDHDSDLSALALLQGQGKNAPATERLTAENNSGHVQVSTLRCAIKEKEVRNKISGNGDRSALGAVVSDCPPTFTTFKFGYLPGRGLLYSVIAHEIALCGLFLFVPYGLVTFRSQKLIIQMPSSAQ